MGRVALLVVLLSSTTLYATTYYVSPTGSDAANGLTTGTAWQHFSKAAAVAVAGDTVIFLDGTYDNEGQVDPNYTVTLTNSGTAGNPITFKAQHRGMAILDGGHNGTANCTTGDYAYINLQDSSYIVIQGFQIQNTCEEGIHNNNTAHHIWIQQNELHHIGNISSTSGLGMDGMFCNAVVHDIYIDSNLFHDIGRTNPGYNLDHALYLECPNSTVTNNIFYNQIVGWDIQLAQGGDNITIAYNTFASHKAGQDGQIMVWNTHNGLTIRNNIFYNPVNTAITYFTPTVSNCVIDHNIVQGASNVYTGTGCTIGTNQLNTVAGMVDPVNHNYQLLSNSLAIGAATDVGVTNDYLQNTRPQNGSYDVGAYEYMAPTSNGSSSVSGAFTISGGVVH